VGDPLAVPAILSALAEAGDREIRMSAAASAALLGGRRAVPALRAVLEDPRGSPYVLVSACLALGHTADPRAVGPLLEIAEPARVKGTYSDLVRAFAVVALGRIADPRDVPALSRLARDLNFHASVPALEEAVTIL
jgi:HEAT repeat protein